MTKTIQQKIDETWDTLKTPTISFEYLTIPDFPDNRQVASALSNLLMAFTDIDDLRCAEFDWDYSKQFPNTAGTGNLGWEQSHPTVSHARATLANHFAYYAMCVGEKTCYLARSDYYILCGLLEAMDGTGFEGYHELVERVLSSVAAELSAKDKTMMLEVLKGTPTI